MSALSLRRESASLITHTSAGSCTASRAFPLKHRTGQCRPVGWLKYHGSQRNLAAALVKKRMSPVVLITLCVQTGRLRLMLVIGTAKLKF